MPSDIRIHLLRHWSDFLGATEKASGLHVLTNVSIEGGEPEAVRLNLRSPNSSLRRSTSSTVTRFPRGEQQFDILNPSVLLSASQLSDLQDNFAAVHQALGDRRLGTFKTDDPVHETLLPSVQSASFEMAWIDRLLATLSLDSALYRSYLSHSKRRITLLDGLRPTATGEKLMANFGEAVDLYSQVPELRAYLDQDDVRIDDFGPRGQQFRQWFQGSTLTNGHGISLDYVAHELRPLRLSGRSFQWKLDDKEEILDSKGRRNDLRRVTVDLLVRYQGNPIWCEVKMRHDSWATAALQQVLLYGSMICSGNQMRRCRRFYSNEFDRFTPWLGILIEEQAEDGFIEDFEQAIMFSRLPMVQELLKTLFEGVLFAVLRSDENGWTMSRVEVV